MKNFRISNWFAGGLLAAALIAPAAQADVTLKLGWTTSDSALDPYAMGARIFKEEVEKETNGTVKIQLFPNRQLGDERQMLEGLRFGTVDLALVTNSVVSQVEPAFQLFDLPFLFGSSEQAYKVLDSEIGQAMSEKLKAKGIINLGYTEGGFRHMLNNKQPVQQPSDVQGVKYRVMQNPMFIDMFSRLGGSAIPMAWGETYTAVQQGTIDGLEGATSVFYASKFQEIAKYLSLTGHNYSAVELLGSARSLKKLSPEQMAQVEAAAARTVTRQRAEADALGTKTVELMREGGVAVNNIEDVAVFREVMTPVYDKTRKVVGDEIMDKTLDMLK